MDIELIKLIYAKVIDKMSNRLVMNQAPIELATETGIALERQTTSY